MSSERPSAEILSKIEKALNTFLRDDLDRIDDLNWRAEIEHAAIKLDRRLNAALREADAGFFVSVKINPARITV